MKYIIYIITTVFTINITSNNTKYDLKKTINWLNTKTTDSISVIDATGIRYIPFNNPNITYTFKLSDIDKIEVKRHNLIGHPKMIFFTKNKINVTEKYLCNNKEYSVLSKINNLTIYFNLIKKKNCKKRINKAKNKILSKRGKIKESF